MPHPTVPTAPTAPTGHAEHDPLLVAAYAAGDATGAQLDEAAGLVATCHACGALHHDLRAIALALPASAAVPPSPRPRDFRLTAVQAASLAPTGWRRLLAPFAGPSFAFARPLGTGLATIGLAGILVAGASGIPLGGGAAAAPAGDQEAFAPMTASEPSAAPSMAPAAGELYESNASATEAPAAGDGSPASSPDPTVPKESDQRSDCGGEPQASDELLTAIGAPAEGQEPPNPTMAAAEASPLAPPTSSAAWLAALGFVALALGAGLLVLRWTALRWTARRVV